MTQKWLLIFQNAGAVCPGATCRWVSWQDLLPAGQCHLTQTTSYRPHANSGHQGASQGGLPLERASGLWETMETRVESLIS